MAKFEKKYNLAQVKQIFEAANCQFLEEEYLDMLTPMRYRCSCGKESMIRLFSFLNGSRCKDCGREKMRQRLRKPFDVVKAEFEAVGYTVLSSDYISNQTPIHYLCDKGHVGYSSYSNFRRGRRCKRCFVERYAGSGHPYYDSDRKAVAERRTFRARCKSLVRCSLNLMNKQKLRKSEDLLGYKADDLRTRMLNHPDARGEWTIDHIFPIKAFVDHGIDDLSVINALDNLRPLSKIDNFRKNAHYVKEDFLLYLRLKGINVD